MALTPEQIAEMDAITGLPPTVPNQSAIDARLAEIDAIATEGRKIQAQGGEDTELGDTIGNIIPSAGRAIGDLGTAIGGLSPLGVKEKPEGGSQLEARVPPTLRALFDLGAGVVEKAMPGEQEHEATANAVGQYFADRYGGGNFENAKKTIINDPIGALLDVASVLTAGGGAIKAAGKIAKVGAIEKTGKVLETAGKVTDPLMMSAKGAKKVVQGAGAVTRELTGLTTGAGGKAVAEAFRNPTPELIQSMRGKTSKRDIVDVARNALSSLEEKRGATYRGQLEEISKQGDSLDLSPLTKERDTQLTKFGISKGKDGTLDFSRSAISKPEARNGVQEISDLIDDWGTKKGDRTPIKVDILKRRLGDYNLESGQARALVFALQEQAKKILNTQVKGYKEMTSGYAQASSFIEDLEKGMALGEKPTEVAITKFANALKEDKEFRLSLVKELETATGVKITPQIAGSALNSWLPRGMISRLYSGGVVGAGIVSPQLILGLAVSLGSFSPRIVGEIAVALGIAKNKVGDVLKAINTIKQKVPGIGNMNATQLEQALIQAGRIRETDEKWNPPKE